MAMRTTNGLSDDYDAFAMIIQVKEFSRILLLDSFCHFCIGLGTLSSQVQVAI